MKICQAAMGAVETLVSGIIYLVNVHFRRGVKIIVLILI
jgi:hypothetical protein